MSCCQVCSAPATQFCASCGQVFYCSREHQIQHWKQQENGHKRECDQSLVWKHSEYTQILLAESVRLFYPKENSKIPTVKANRNIKKGELLFVEHVICAEEDSMHLLVQSNETLFNSLRPRLGGL